MHDAPVWRGNYREWFRGAGSAAYVSGRVWVGADDAYYGTPDGVVVGMNKGRVVFPPDLSSGAGLMMGDNFIQVVV